MDYETVRCNECGAVLQVPSSVRYVTCSHCNVPLEVHRTGIATYTEAIQRPGAGGPPRPSDPAWREMADRMERLERQNELARIDREWDMERDRLLRFQASNRYGRRPVPTVTTAIITGVVFGVLGLGGLAFGIIFEFTDQGQRGDGGGVGCAFMGVFFLVIGAVVAVVNYNQARRYDQAYRDYQDRRASVMGEPRPLRDEDY